jgi:hypothetical protein
MTDTNTNKISVDPDEMGDLKLLSLPTLYAIQEALAAADEQIMTSKANLQGELRRRFEPKLSAALAEDGKTYGSKKLPGEGHLRIEAEAPQKVDWDQRTLRSLAETMAWPDVDHTFKITFSVPEKIYGALPPSSDLKAALTKARTTKPQPTKFKIVTVD